MVEIAIDLSSAIIWASYGYWMRGKSGINYGWLLVSLVAGLITYQLAKGILLHG